MYVEALCEFQVKERAGSGRGATAGDARGVMAVGLAGTGIREPERDGSVGNGSSSSCIS